LLELGRYTCIANGVGAGGAAASPSKIFRQIWAKFRPIWANLGKNLGKI